MANFFIESEGPLGRWQVNGLGSLRGLGETSASLKARLNPALDKQSLYSGQVTTLTAQLATAQDALAAAQRRTAALEEATPEWMNSFKDGTPEEWAAYRLIAASGQQAVVDAIPVSQAAEDSAQATIDSLTPQLSTAKSNYAIWDKQVSDIVTQYNSAVSTESKSISLDPSVSTTSTLPFVTSPDAVPLMDFVAPPASSNLPYIIGGAAVLLVGIAYFTLRK